ncbi:hypothetical protein ERK14_03515 [Lactobacillus kunkeei]|uniref:Transcriptional regulator n=1 Tax=Apilactobacillus nanyangensis TaxID=2799579 RepID=A0ABT0HX03_9LACO|nr:hypothetical protein [Apilactobacillus nanyangensis]MBC6388634.1 hypothetical protein [Apilactobacillus kunkeei]MCK8611428.1 hypothetical protein [Apilactobacillus nanyangensis]TMT00556.1 hypothetical protein FD687_05300 [Apilactobacillus kunkeei]TMT03511.1 hypothetical protein FD689_04985 [Apilactobacillus kunkeei]CAI2627722.1 hypothetical protein AKUA1404_02530 [Apilactobacillus kunkeei]
MQKQWNKSKITIETLGSDQVVRKRNMANAIQDVSGEEMAQLTAIITELTGSSAHGSKLVQENSFIG